MTIENNPGGKSSGAQADKQTQYSGEITSICRSSFDNTATK